MGFSEVLSDHARARCEVLRGLLSALRDLLCGLGLTLQCVVRQQQCGVKCTSVGVYVQCEVLYFNSFVFSSHVAGEGDLAFKDQALIDVVWF